MKPAPAFDCAPCGRRIAKTRTHYLAGDLGKLLRSTLDGLKEAGAYRDDAQVVTITAAKRYADARPPGATVTITTIGEDEQ